MIYNRNTFLFQSSHLKFKTPSNLISKLRASWTSTLANTKSHTSNQHQSCSNFILTSTTNSSFKISSSTCKWKTSWSRSRTTTRRSSRTSTSLTMRRLTPKEILRLMKDQLKKLPLINMDPRFVELLTSGKT